VSDLSTYVVSSLLWALAGLVTGYLAGSYHATRSSRQGDPVPHRATHSDNLIGLIVIFMAIVSVVATAVNTHRQGQVIARQTEVIECQTAYNRAFVSGLQGRSDAAAQERAAQRKLITTPNPDRDPAIAQRAVQDYLSALADADARRDESPLPTDPRC
jgi:hypothetical protein